MLVGETVHINVDWVAGALWSALVATHPRQEVLVKVLCAGEVGSSVPVGN